METFAEFLLSHVFQYTNVNDIFIPDKLFGSRVDGTSYNAQTGKLREGWASLQLQYYQYKDISIFSPEDLKNLRVPGDSDLIKKLKEKGFLPKQEEKH